MQDTTEIKNEPGVPHWKWQRYSAVVLIPLTLWILFSLIHHIGADYATATAWVAHPLVAFLLCVFIVTLFYHSKLGMQVIIEDYIADVSARNAVIKIVNLICLLAIILGVSSVIKIAL